MIVKNYSSRAGTRLHSLLTADVTYVVSLEELINSQASVTGGEEVESDIGASVTKFHAVRTNINGFTSAEGHVP